MDTKKLDENGDVVYKTDKQGNIKLNSQGKPKPELESAYSGLQDRIYDHMTGAGFPALTRGTKGSRKKHLHHMEFKAQEEAKMAEVWAMFVESDKETAIKYREQADADEKRARYAQIEEQVAHDRSNSFRQQANEALDELNEINRQSDEAYDELREIERLIDETKAPLHEAQRLNPQAVKMAMEKIIENYHEREHRSAAARQQQPAQPVKMRSKGAR